MLSHPLVHNINYPREGAILVRFCDALLAYRTLPLWALPKPSLNAFLAEIVHAGHCGQGLHELMQADAAIKMGQKCSMQDFRRSITSHLKWFRSWVQRGWDGQLREDSLDDILLIFRLVETPQSKRSLRLLKQGFPNGRQTRLGRVKEETVVSGAPLVKLAWMRSCLYQF